MGKGRHMNKYILLWREPDDTSTGWKLEEGDGESKIDYLEERSDIVSRYEWVIFEVASSAHKDEYVHSGEIDHLLEEE